MIENLRARDEGAWTQMVRLYYPLVYRWTRRSGVDAHGVSDVCQEVFLAVSNGLDRFRRDRPTDGFRRWLRGITEYKINDHWRALRERGVGGSDATRQLTEYAANVPSESGESVPIDLVQRAAEMIGPNFDGRTWDAFRRVARGDKPADVAEDLGMTVNAIYKLKARILRQLRDLAGESLDE
ncbi:RNA polymerase sigma factor [Kolteria novifilia]|uniref:RNA polymerase sigma factor n=1 Tax=Kolteria novifilia TaxID=2527975 RepID=UPI003AF383FE